MKKTTEATKDQTPKTSTEPKAAKAKKATLAPATEQPAPQPAAASAKVEWSAKATKAAKSDTDGEATDRLPTTLDELKETKGGFVAFHFLTGKDKDAIERDLAASFKLTEPQAAKIVRRITGRGRLYARVFELFPWKKQSARTAPRRPSATQRGFFVSRRASETVPRTSKNRPRRYFDRPTRVGSSRSASVSLQATSCRQSLNPVAIAFGSAQSCLASCTTVRQICLRMCLSVYL